VSERTESVRGIDPVFQPYLDLWASQLDEASESARALLANISGAADAKAWQRRWLEAVRASMDAFMRSPAYLYAMKQNLHAIVKTKMQADDLYQEFARNNNIPTAHDLSGLFERLRSAEDMILNRLQAIEEELEEIKRGFSTMATNGDGDPTEATKGAAAGKKRSGSSRKDGGPKHA
jgi:hypothetical protein